MISTLDQIENTEFKVVGDSEIDFSRGENLSRNQFKILMGEERNSNRPDSRIVVSWQDIQSMMRGSFILGAQYAVDYITTRTFETNEQTSIDPEYYLGEVNSMAVSTDAIFHEQQENHRAVLHAIGELDKNITALVTKYDRDIPDIQNRLGKLEDRPSKKSQNTQTVLIIIFGAITALGTWFAPALLNWIEGLSKAVPHP